MSSLKSALEAAQAAARALRTAPHSLRCRALEALEAQLLAHKSKILEANAQDVEAATEISSALKDRLTLTPARVEGMIRAAQEVRALPDPLAQTRELGQGRAGFRVTRRCIPLGVIAIVYEARPNVTAECAALGLKSGNVMVLRGGKEARRSNEAIGEAIHAALREVGLPTEAMVLLTSGDRAQVVELLGATGQVDLVIPRGGAGLMAMVDENARVPVIRHGQGICQVYVDKAAQPKMAIEIAHNAKVHRPGVCNAMETLLVHEAQLHEVLPQLGARLVESGVNIRADARAHKVLSDVGVEAQEAVDQDWDTEFLSLDMAIRTVDSLEAALDHIAAHGTHHTASIVTEDEAAAERFLGEVDCSCVLWNASTRFNDGGELGLGAEMGISTSKMHAYGPMSLHELCAEKLVVYGQGQVR